MAFWEASSDRPGCSCRSSSCALRLWYSGLVSCAAEQSYQLCNTLDITLAHQRQSPRSALISKAPKHVRLVHLLHPQPRFILRGLRGGARGESSEMEPQPTNQRVQRAGITPSTRLNASSPHTITLRPQHVGIPWALPPITPRANWPTLGGSMVACMLDWDVLPLWRAFHFCYASTLCSILHALAIRPAIPGGLLLCRASLCTA